ncbi:MAG TPA: hypothetical protein ENN49_00510 [Bacteroidales bacterium]|nr:hypothetical protein [Bacteroidales bacterium]
MKTISHKVFFLLIAWLPFLTLGQTKTEIDETYRDANSYFYFEDYEEALALYQKIYKFQPNNHNLNYRIGICYLNIPGSKHKSIQFLEKAVQNTTSRYNEESITEQRAPIDAIFYLGNAYLTANRLDEALRAYEKFYNLTKGKGNWDFDYFNHQVNVAKNSIKIQRNPVDFIMANLGEKINDRFPNFNAVVSGNGKVLAYTTKLKFYNAINISRKNDKNQWEKPVNITLDLQTDISCSTLCLSFDGNELYLYRDDNHDGNIYVTRYNGKKWSPIKKLNSNINTEAYETHASLSPDGKQLFFTSNRKGGFGGLDIWVSTRTSGDDWGPARNLGATINTPFNENTPFISTDGTTLYFSSEGHDNMGGYDIFVSQLSDKGNWTTPINLGFPLNTTDDDLFYHPIEDGATALIARFDDNSFGETDIFEIELFIPRFRKSIVSKTVAQERTTDKTFLRLIVDTISTKGMASIFTDEAITKIDISGNNTMKLYLNGKAYGIIPSKLVELAEAKRGSETENTIKASTEETNQSPSFKPSSLVSDATVSYNFGDTTPRYLWPTDTPSVKQKTMELNKANLTDDNYFSEILLLLTPREKHQDILPVLKKNWKFNTENLNETIIHFASSFKTDKQQNTIIYSLTQLYDEIGYLNKTESAKREQKFAKKDRTLIIKAYNELINKASKQLGNDLALVMLKNKEIQNLTQFIELYSRQNAEGFMTKREELTLLLAQLAIGEYVALPNDKKISLYNSSTGKVTIEPSYIWLWVLLTLIAMGVIIYLGIEYYKKRTG